MSRHRARTPAKALLARLWWPRNTVRCHDGAGRRGSVYVWRFGSDAINMVVPGGESVRLSHAEAGQLRAALRDALMTDSPVNAGYRGRIS